MGIGFTELAIILVIILIMFGAGKLPEIGSAFGKGLKNFKSSMKEAKAEDEPAVVEVVEGQVTSEKTAQEKTESGKDDQTPAP